MTASLIVFERHLVEREDGTSVAALLRDLADVTEALEARTDGSVLEVRVQPTDTNLRAGWVTFRPTPADDTDH